MDSLHANPIVPHEAAKSGTTYTYEVLFRSMNFYLIDLVTAGLSFFFFFFLLFFFFFFFSFSFCCLTFFFSMIEYNFCIEFFGKEADTFSPIFRFVPFLNNYDFQFLSSFSSLYL